MTQYSTSNPFKKNAVIDVSGLFCCDRCGDELTMAVYDPANEVIKWECRNDHYNEVRHRV